jgi:hypothetical protein
MPLTAHEFLATHQTQLVQLLERNTDVSAFIAALLGQLVSYANEQGIPFEDVLLVLPHIANIGGAPTVVATISHR